MLRPIRNWVKVEIKSSKKTASGIIIKSQEGEYHEAWITEIGWQAKEANPELEIGKRVELMTNCPLNIFKEDSKEYALIDAGSIIGVYDIL
jgi:co-chaperonin GroES (HSP10)